MFNKTLISLVVLTDFVKASYVQLNSDLEVNVMSQVNDKKHRALSTLEEEALAFICEMFESDLGRELLTKTLTIFESVTGQSHEVYTTENEEEALMNFSYFLEAGYNRIIQKTNNQDARKINDHFRNPQIMSLKAKDCFELFEIVEKLYLHEASYAGNILSCNSLMQFEHTQMTWNQIQDYKNCFLVLRAIITKFLLLDQFLKLKKETVDFKQDTHEVSLPCQPTIEGDESIEQKFAELFTDYTDYIKWLDSIKLIKTIQWVHDDLNKAVKELKAIIQHTEEKNG